MGKNPFQKDYRLIENFDESGKVYTSYEYIGDRYFFRSDASVIRAEKKKMPLRAAAAWICFLAALWEESSAMHHLAAALPFAFCALVLALYTGIAVRFWGMKEPLEHRHAERMNNRYPPVLLAAAVLAFISLSGDLFLILKGQGRIPGDLLFALGSAGLCLFGIHGFLVRERFIIEKR